MTRSFPLRWHRLAPEPTEHHISCGTKGAFVGRVPLLHGAQCEPGPPRWAPRALDEINHDLSALYGLPIDASEKFAGIVAVAGALNRGNVPLAQMLLLQQRLPDPSGLAKSETDDQRLAERLIGLYESNLLPGEWMEKIRAFDPRLHPRWPRGDDEGRGGQFQPKDGNPVLIADERDKPDKPRPTVSESKNKSIIELPTNRPPTNREINQFVRQRSRMALPRGARGVGVPPEELAELIERLKEAGVFEWVGDRIARFRSSFDAPLTLDELIEKTKSDKSRGPPGYERHHIVERGPNSEKSTDEQLEDEKNVVTIPYYRHRDISDYYSTKNSNLGGRTPRDFLRGKTFEEQYKFGVEQLRKFGVIK
jgi:DNA-binding Lrp family transcriptional regulator